MKTRPKEPCSRRKPLPPGRGFPAPATRSILSAARASAPTIFALLVGLAIVLRPGQVTEPVSTSSQPPGTPTETRTVAPARKPPRLEAENTSAVKSGALLVSAPVVPESVAGITGQAPVDWLRLLYPDLARISELEREPVAAALIELSPMVDSEDPAVRLAVVEALGDMTTNAVLPTLSMALHDPEAEIRVAALEAVASLEDAAMIGRIEGLLYDPDRRVRLAAFEALADLGNETAVHALAGLVGDPDARVRFDAIAALADIGGESAGLYLEQARYDPDSRIRRYAETVFRELD